MEAEHTFIVQLTSFIEMAASFIVLFLMFKAYRRYTPGPVKRIILQFAVQMAILSVALVFMLIYHVWDVDFAKDMWHYAALAAMLLGLYVYIKFIQLNKMFNVTNKSSAGLRKNKSSAK